MLCTLHHAGFRDTRQPLLAVTAELVAAEVFGTGAFLGRRFHCSQPTLTLSLPAQGMVRESQGKARDDMEKQEQAGPVLEKCQAKHKMPMLTGFGKGCCSIQKST